MYESNNIRMAHMENLSDLPVSEESEDDSLPEADQEEKLNNGKEEMVKMLYLSEQNSDTVWSRSNNLLLLLACCVCNGLVTGYSYGMGVLFLEMKNSLHSTRVGTAMIQSVTIGTMCGAGIISPLLTHLIGPGNTLILGTTIACSSIIGGFFLNNICTLIVIVGGIGGMGLSFMYTSIFIAVSQIFKNRYRSSFAALSLSGGIAYCVFPYLNALLMEAYGWRGEFLVHVALLSNTIPLGLCIRNALPNLQEDSKNSFSRLFADGVYLKSHVSLWKDPLHVTFFVCLILRSVPLGLVTYFMLDIAISKNFTEYDGSVFLSAIGFGNIVGRALILVTRCACRKLSPVVEYCLYCVFTGCTLVLLAQGREFWLMILFSSMMGVGFGTLSSTASIVVFVISELERYPTALGIYNTGLGIGFGIAGPLGGFLRDEVKSYDILLYGFAIISITSGLALLAVALTYKRKKKSQSESIPDIVKYEESSASLK